MMRIVGKEMVNSDSLGKVLQGSREMGLEETEWPRDVSLCHLEESEHLVRCWDDWA